LKSNSPATNALRCTNTFYTPTVTASNTLVPALYTNTNTFYTPTVATSYTLAPALYTNSNTFYNATVAASNTLVPALYTNTNEFYTPTVAQVTDLTPALYTNTNTFYTPLFTQILLCEDYVEPDYVYPGYVSWPAFNVNVFYTSTIEVGVSYLLPALFTNNNELYGPVLAAPVHWCRQGTPTSSYP